MADINRVPSFDNEPLRDEPEPLGRAEEDEDAFEDEDEIDEEDEDELDEDLDN